MQKYLLELKSKYDAEKKAMKSKEFFTMNQDVNIEMENESDLDEDDT